MCLLFLLSSLDCEVYSLKSVGFFRQYALNLFNIPLSYFFNQFVHVARGSDYKTIVVSTIINIKLYVFL